MKKQLCILFGSLIGLLGIVWIVQNFLINTTTPASKPEESTQVTKIEEEIVKQQWNQGTDLKMIKRFSTFLFKTNIEDPVKEKLLTQAKQKQVYNLTHAEKVALLERDLVNSELLYADVVKVLETKGDYTKVAAVQQPNGSDEYGYVGWVFSTDLIDIPETFKNAKQQVVIKTKTVSLSDTDVSLGTYLPLIEEKNDHYLVATLSGEEKIAKDDALVRGKEIKDPIKLLLDTAKDQLGKGYVWAGTSSRGFDCSGYTYTLYRLLNVELSRDTPYQIENGTSVNYEDVKPGDLLFFKNDDGIIHHVGIYLDNGKMIHSPNENSEVSIMAIKGSVYEKELIDVRRIVNNK